MSPNVQALSRKIETLSSDQIHEVERFVELLGIRGQERELTCSAAEISAPAFAAVWDNPEDDVYDAL